MRPFYDQQIAAANVARFRVPVVPGSAAALPGAFAAGPGEPGHMERLVRSKPAGAVWPLRTRWRDLKG